MLDRHSFVHGLAHPTRPRAVATVGVLAAGVLVLAACGGSSSSSSTSTTSAPTATTASPTTTASSSTLRLASTSLGMVVVDATGRTVYTFDKDKAGSGVSACTGGCATEWSPVTVKGTPSADTGISGTVNVLLRPDGTEQVQLSGHPLYLFAGDHAAGDTNGNGVAGLWHVVPAGGPAAAAASGTTTAPPTTTHATQGTSAPTPTVAPTAPPTTPHTVPATTPPTSPPHTSPPTTSGGYGY